MIDWFLFLALLLMVLGIVGSAIPALPGPLLSISGAILYWWSTGYSTPNTVFLFLIVSTGILALILDTLAGYYGASKGEASRQTAIRAAIASIILFPFTGPLGIIIGTVAVVVAREMMLGEDFDNALRTGFYTTLGILGSVVAKVLLTLLMLALFIISLAV